MEIIFLTKSEILALHTYTLAKHSGSPGLRDEGSLESASQAPENRYYYEEADLIACAAAYAYHLSQAHAFVDGNKRVAAAATAVFLEVNGVPFDVTEDDFIALFLNIAAGDISRDDVEESLRGMLT
ncbi:MAG: type II toxin-antitoxin system death-on-curing family toxin [Chloroflexota bacterium]